MFNIDMNFSKDEITLDKAFYDFQKYNKAKNLSEKTISYYDDCFDIFTDYFQYTNFCNSLNQQLIIDYIIHLKEKNIKSTTINSYLRGIRTFVNYCINLGYTKQFAISLLKTDKVLKSTYSDEELIILLKKPNVNKCSFTEYRNWVIINYVMATGNRLSTMINIKIRKFRF